MTWKIVFLEEALQDIEKLDKSSRIQVIKAINKTSTNPLPTNKGGYGKPLGNKQGRNLSGLLKIKLRKSGIRVVYKVEIEKGNMLIIVVSVRESYKVYDIAVKRLREHS